MDIEQARVLMQVSCLIENIENAGNEYGNMIRRNGAILEAYEMAKERLDELLDRNQISEFQKAFRHLDKALKEAHSCLTRMQGFNKQLDELLERF